MGLIIVKNQSVDSIKFKNAVKEAFNLFENSIISLVVINRYISIKFAETNFRKMSIKRMTDVELVKDSDIAIISIVDDYKGYNHAWRYLGSTLLRFDTAYGNDSKWESDGPYFVLFGDYPYTVHKTALGTNIENSRKFVVDKLSSTNIYYALLHRTFHRIPDLVTEIDAVSNLVIGSDESFWIKNENDYYENDDILYSSKELGMVIANKLSGVDNSVEVQKGYRTTSAFLKYKSVVYYNLDMFYFVNKTNTFYSNSTKIGDTLIAVKICERTTKVTLVSLIDKSKHEIYLYDLFKNFATVPINPLHNG